MYEAFTWCEDCRNFIHFDMGGFGECGASGADCFYCESAEGCPSYGPILALPAHEEGAA